ncbi:carbon monoxyde dehydrogenase (large chain), CoxL_2 [Mycobacterium marinum M]|uniref:Carbon monoxyde dehydrogenase (Large chain), CoxL_2 n=1 Tax=Mycobacterium marinum (strain ATCC BAA-535 / M) TaxID=216594 RepID=B2HIC5_MYCMM|nr:xanthine dehydrogenase family protein molybdopterin-binding subunit [Mycobacterium marinum]ACC38551.1 carbon monoxyde dehydrogenase (large chain), CoxL_2 [Mycobacterium marinum M]
MTTAPATRGAMRFARVEAYSKITGTARYAADHRPEGLLYAVLVGAPVAAGRLKAVDADAALGSPGVVAVLIADDLPDFPLLSPPSAVRRMPLMNNEIHYEGQAVAIVIAESIEAAEAARALVVVDCERTNAVVLGSGTREPADGEYSDPFDKGDFDTAWSNAAIRVERTYLQPPRHHHAMETSGTVAQWDEDQLTLWDAVQASATVPPVIATALGIDAHRIRIVAPHIGGGFGSKSFVWPHQTLAAAAARVTGRPVKLHLRRADQFSSVGYQPWMEQTMRLAADRTGRLIGIEHVAVNNTGMVDNYVEPATTATKGLYAADAIRTRQFVERVNLNVPTPMRAPLEGPGMWALESAMNELADEAGMDPLDLRLANYAENSPADGRPWSSNRLREAYAEGARRYRWRERYERPRAEGPWAIGHGMATCTMGSFRFPSQARVRLRDDGTAVVEANVHDIGTGVQTILCQIAAAELGISSDRVEILWGDTDLPTAGPAYGSSTTMSVGSAVAAAARHVVNQLAALGIDDPAATGIAEVVGEGRFSTPGGGTNLDGEGTPFAIRAWGAVFVEVGVDRDLGLIRLRHAVGVYSAGRILNPVTARAQMIGGIIWGWGKATLEASTQEPTYGRWLAKNLSNVALPVNADIPAAIDVSFIDEFDSAASLIGARGIGELGATGVDAAVAAAVYDAVGVRVRELPILPWQVLS